MRVKRWARLWWLSVPEPRSFSIGWGAAYLMLGCAGLAALLAPPIALGGAEGWGPAVLSLGGLNIVGVIIAMVSGWCDFWWGERLGLAAIICAAAIYAGLLVTLREDPLGGTGIPFFYVAFALVVLGLRYLMIRWFTFRPREG